MYQLRISLLSAIIFSFAIGACKKKTKDANEVTFVNQTSAKVTMDIYNTLEDYTQSNPVMMRKTLQAGERIILPGTTFSAGKSYYMDWYSDDYYQSNWFNDAYPQEGAQVMFTPKTGATNYNLASGLRGNSRSAFLKGNSSSTSWLAIDAYTYSTQTGYISYWNNFTNADKYRTITINKNFVANYNYRDANNKIVETNMNFRVQNADIAYIEFMDPTGTSLGSMYSGTLPTAAAPKYSSSAIDTVLALFPNSPYYFMMVRQ